jgi:tyrosyl-tRNA synthetase
MPLLEGTDGVNKMSKSLGNYIGINESPKDIFGKTMSISDELMARYFELLTDEDLEKAKGMHPKEAKARLAALLVALFHGQRAASDARKEFDRVFKDKSVPENIPLRRLAIEGDRVSLLDLLDLGLELLHTNNTKNELRRMIQQGAVKVNGEKVGSVEFQLSAGAEYLIQVSKRSFVRLVLSKR